MMVSLHVDDYFPITLRDSIFIRPVREKDAEALFREVDKNRDRLSKVLPWVPTITDVSHELQFVQTAMEQEKNGTSLSCGIFKANGSQLELEEVIGAIGLVEINGQTQSAMLGYWLSKDHTGTGLCTLACGKLIEYGQAIGIKRFEIRAGAENIRSQAVANRLGFCKLGVIENADVVNGIPVTHVIFALGLPEPATT